MMNDIPDKSNRLVERYFFVEFVELSREAREKLVTVRSED